MVTIPGVRTPESEAIGGTTEVGYVGFSKLD
jgi:hypothetical protein